MLLAKAHGKPKSVRVQSKSGQISQKIDLNGLRSESKQKIVSTARRSNQKSRINLNKQLLTSPTLTRKPRWAAVKRLHSGLHKRRTGCSAPPLCSKHRVRKIASFRDWKPLVGTCGRLFRLNEFFFRDTVLVRGRLPGSCCLLSQYPRTLWAGTFTCPKYDRLELVVYKMCEWDSMKNL